MRVGAPFNPYKVFRGVFAPFWLLEHQGVGAGAKLCYIRLLGFAGKDARCYPSLQQLGMSLGVSERQARDYVKELERAGLIQVEQRGLRRTNVYLFVWTAELESLSNSVPDTPDDPEGQKGGTPQGEPPERNNRSGQDRNCTAAPDRNSSSGLGRNTASGPIGRNSEGNSSVESSSSPAAEHAEPQSTTTTTTTKSDPEMAPAGALERPDFVAETIFGWARGRGLQRLRSDRKTGLPEKEHLTQWSRIFADHGIPEPRDIYAVLDAAHARANRSGEWRNWAFLTLQIQLAAERILTTESVSAPMTGDPSPITGEDPACEWARAKERIRTQIPEIPFSNWFDRTRQVDRKGNVLLVAVPDEPARTYLETEYADITARVVATFGIREVKFISSCRAHHLGSERHGT